MLGVRPLLQDLSPSASRELSLSGQIKRFHRGQLIFGRGHDSPSFCIVESGQVRFSNVGIDGRRTATGTMDPGDSFGEFTVFADSPRFFDFYAATEVRLRIISRARFEALLARSPELSNAIIRLLARRLLVASDLLEDLRHLSLEARLCKYLYRHWNEAKAERGLSLTQEAIAEELAVSRVALAQSLAKLRRQKVIRTGYRRIEVLDPAALAQMVEDGAQLTGLRPARE